MSPGMGYKSLEKDLPDMQPRQGCGKNRTDIESLPNELLLMITIESQNWAILLVSRRFASLLDLLPKEALVGVAKEILFRPELDQGNKERQDDHTWAVRSENITERPTDAHFQLHRLFRHPGITTSTIRAAGRLWLRDRFEPALERFVSVIDPKDPKRSGKRFHFEKFMQRANRLFACATGLYGCVDHKPKDSLWYNSKASNAEYGSVTLHMELSCHKKDSRTGMRLRPATLRLKVSLEGSHKSKNPILQAPDEHGRAICVDMRLFQNIVRHKAATVPPELIRGMCLDVPERREALRYLLDRTDTRTWALPAGSELAAAGAEAVSFAIERADTAILSAFTGISLLLESESASWTLTEPGICKTHHCDDPKLPFIAAYVAADSSIELPRKKYLEPLTKFHQCRHLVYGAVPTTIEPWIIAGGKASQANKRLVTLDLNSHLPAILRNSDKLGADWVVLLLIAAFYHGKFTPDLHCFPWPRSELPTVDENLKLELLDGLAQLIHRRPNDWHHYKQVVALHQWLSSGEREPRNDCFQDKDVCRCKDESRAQHRGAVKSVDETAPKQDGQSGESVRTYPSLKVSAPWPSIDQVLSASETRIPSDSADTE